MPISHRVLTLVAPAALLALSACATGIPAKVSRFQAMPAPGGQSFIIQPAGPADRGGLEFAHYAGLVRQHLLAKGYSEAPAAQSATLIVSLNYGVNEGRQRTASTPSPYPHGGLGYGHPFYRPYYSRYGYAASRRYPYYRDWYDPYAYSPFGLDQYGRETYTVYDSFVDVDIKRVSDGQSVFEGLAKARSANNELPALVPSLVEAMFTDFPGRSGETVRITIPAPAAAR